MLAELGGHHYWAPRADARSAAAPTTWPRPPSSGFSACPAPDAGRDAPHRRRPARARGAVRGTPRRASVSAPRLRAAGARRDTVAVDDQRRRRRRASSSAARVCERRRARSGEGRRSTRSRAAPAHGRRKPLHARAQQLLDRVRETGVLARSSGRPARRAFVRPRARRAGCRASRRRSGAAAAAADVSPSRRDRRRRIAPRLSGADLEPLEAACSSTCSSADALPRLRARRNATALPSRRRAAKASASAEGGSSHWTSSIATSSGSRAARIRSALRKPTPVACGAVEPSGLFAQQRNLERVPLRRRQTAQRSDVDAVEQVDQAGEREPRLGAATARDEHAHRARLRGLDAGLPESRLADAGPPVSRRAWSGRRGFQDWLIAAEFRLAPDDRGTVRSRSRRRSA